MNVGTHGNIERHTDMQANNKRTNRQTATHTQECKEREEEILSESRRRKIELHCFGSRCSDKSENGAPT